MTLDDDLGAPRHDIAIGPSPVAAGHAFGRDHDDVVLAGYDEMATLELGAAASVAVVVAPGCDEAFASVAALAGTPAGPRLESAAALEHHELLLALLDRHGLEIEQVRPRSSGGVAYALSPVQGHRDPAADHRLLAAVAAATPLPATGSAGPVQTPRPVPVERAAASRDAPRPTPPLVRLLQQLAALAEGRRRRAYLAAVVALVVLVLLLLTALAATGSGGTAVLVLLLGAAGLTTGVALLVAVLLLARQVHRQTERLESLLREQQRALREVDERQSGRVAELALTTDLTHEYLESIATAEAVRGQDLHVALSDLAERAGTSPTRRA